MNPIQISRTGLDVEWQRLQIIAENIANMNTTRTADGKPYQALRLLSGPKADFSTMIANRRADIHALHGVDVFGVEAMPTGTRRVYEPNHPHADADGFVTYPNIDQSSEMTLMIKTSRVYQADLSVMAIAQQMYSHAVEFGK